MNATTIAEEKILNLEKREGEVLVKAGAEKTPGPVTAAENDKAQEGQKKRGRGRPPKIEKKDLTLTKKAIAGMIETPFHLIGGMLKDPDYKMPDELREIISETGYEVYLAFGEEMFNKYTLVTIFAMAYGAAHIVAYSGHNQRKREKKNEPGNDGEKTLKNL